MISNIADGMVLAGTLILAASLATTWRLVGQLASGPLRAYWGAMVALILVFIVGYLGYAYTFTGRQTSEIDLIVPGIFLLGAGFVWLASMLSLRTALAMGEISKLEREHITDPLTGAYNRRFLDQRLAEEVTRAKRHESPLSLLMVDIDGFKEINDQYGRAAGDRVLSSVVRAIRSQLRASDVVARCGGEEFMVVAPHTNAAGAAEFAERMRAHLETSRPKLSGRHAKADVRLTCSIGVTSLAKGSEDIDELVRRVESNLQRAKREGRNRVQADEAGTEASSA